MQLRELLLQIMGLAETLEDPLLVVDFFKRTYSVSQVRFSLWSFFFKRPFFVSQGSETTKSLGLRAEGLLSHNSDMPV